MSNRVAIVGGGFSGTVLAANLLTQASPDCTEIVLIERGPDIGRGLAYAVHDYPHLLNVPAGRLSADAQDPLQFLRFAQRTRPDAGAEDFLPRQLYGAYLQDFLARAERAASGMTLTRVYAEATGITRHADRDVLVVEVADGEPIPARYVVLAVGNPPPRLPPWAEALAAHPLWQRLPEIERRRFVRHLQGHWDVHRHRLPPQLADHIEALRRGGRLEINAGRISTVVPDGGRLQVSWCRRGSGVPQTVVVDALINATGPDYMLRRSRDRLLSALNRDGWISEDALNLGLRPGAHGACVGGDGTASKRLYYLGPMLRAHHWEATAAPELRNHAERLAQHLGQVGA